MQYFEEGIFILLVERFMTIFLKIEEDYFVTFLFNLNMKSVLRRKAYFEGHGKERSEKMEESSTKRRELLLLSCIFTEKFFCILNFHYIFTIFD